MDQGNQSGCEILIQMNFQHCRSMQGMMAADMCHLVTSISSSEASGRGSDVAIFSKQQNYYKC